MSLLLKFTPLILSLKSSIKPTYKTFYTSTIKYGILDNSRVAAANETRLKIELAFQATVKSLLNIKTYTLNDLRREMKESIEVAAKQGGVGGKIQSYIGGKDASILEVETMLKQLENFNSEECLAPTLTYFNFSRKQDIIKRSEGKITDEQITTILLRLQMFQTIHSYIHKRQLAHLPMPTNQEELTGMMKEDKRAAGEMQKKPRFSSRRR